MRDLNRKEYLLSDLEEIHAEGQYGASFRAVVAKKSAGRETAKADGRVVGVDAVEGQDLTDGTTYFIKCPSENLDDVSQQEFVDREYDSGPSINYAAHRIKNSPFGIVRMIGKGSLFNYSAKRGDEARPCLIYAYAGKSTKTRQTLAALRPAKHTWGSMPFLDLARAFARAVQVLHNQGIVHSFIVPRNIICVSGPPKFLGKDRFTLVGFGYARHSDAAARRTDIADPKDGGDTRATEDQWYRAPECRQGQSHARFGYTADLYSIGAILYSLLLDRGTEDGWDVLRRPPADTRLLKRRIFQVAEAMQKNLLWENENILKIIDSCLRYRDEDRFSCVEELIEAIDIARAVDPAWRGARAPKPGPAKTEQEFASLISGQQVVDKEEGASDRAYPSYFLQLRRSLAESMAGSYAGLGRGHFEVYGHRDRIVTSLCRLLGSVRKGSYQTMTLPDYWTDANLGSLGRFLTMNKHMARNGVTIKRLFLVSDEFHKLGEEEQLVLEEQLRALEHLEREDKERATRAAEKFQLRVQVERREEKIADFERNGELVAFLAPEENQPAETVCLNFFSTARETRMNGRVAVKRIIRKVRYWNPEAVRRGPQFNRSSTRFDADWDDAVSLRTFILGKPETAGDARKPRKPEHIKLGELLGLAREDAALDHRAEGAESTAAVPGSFAGGAAPEHARPRPESMNSPRGRPTRHSGRGI
ncbi:MAG: hypothetical protein JNK87_17120 [Bryobacterales bacterium]|nr:hypothetical protein [Bryobacterales bacterium]